MSGDDIANLSDEALDLYARAVTKQWKELQAAVDEARIEVAKADREIALRLRRLAAHKSV
jgi:hypothetical protein